MSRNYNKIPTKKECLKNRLKTLDTQEKALREELAVEKNTARWLDLVSQINSISADKHCIKKYLDERQYTGYVPDRIQIVPLNK